MSNESPDTLVYCCQPGCKSSSRTKCETNPPTTMFNAVPSLAVVSEVKDPRLIMNVEGCAHHLIIMP